MSARLGLGTVQFGLDYGVANVSGRPSDTDIAATLAAAARDGCALFDTAAAYGDSESTLGRLKPGIDVPFISKLVALPPGIDTSSVRTHLDSSLRRSLENLRIDRLDGYLLHNAADLFGPAGAALLDALTEAKATGLTSAVGVSVYDASDVDAVLRLFAPDIVQLPLNIFDRRLLRSGHLDRLKAAGARIHVRSAYLQGAILMQAERLPPHLTALRPLVNELQDRVLRAGVSRAQAALRFLLDLPQVDVVLVGAQSPREWKDSAAAAADRTGIDIDGLSCDDVALVDPRKWPGR